MNAPAQMAELQAQIDALQNRLQALEDLKDREAIAQLLASYGPAVDSNRLQAAADLWADDGSYAVAGFGAHQGRAALVDLLAAPHHQQLLADGWNQNHAYTREVAAALQKDQSLAGGSLKYWSPVGRVDNVYGDRNLFCTCPPVSDFAE